MAAAPNGFKLHAHAAVAPPALWPFTRLVPDFSAPLGYLTHRYIDYRSCDEQLGSRAPRRGWEKVK
jgi:nitrate reductase gamma subunit